MLKLFLLFLTLETASAQGLTISAAAIKKLHLAKKNSISNHTAKQTLLTLETVMSVQKKSPRLQWEILNFLESAAPLLYHPDPKIRKELTKLAQGHIYSDYAQGPRVRRASFLNLAKTYRKTPDGDWMTYQLMSIAPGGECENFMVCNLDRLEQEVRDYLIHFPVGSHIDDVCAEILATIELETIKSMDRSAGDLKFLTQFMREFKPLLKKVKCKHRKKILRLIKKYQDPRFQL